MQLRPLLSSRRMSTFSAESLSEVSSAAECEARGDWAGARQLLDRADEIFAAVPPLRLDVGQRLARVLQLQGDLAAESSQRQRVLEFARGAGAAPAEIARAGCALALCLVRGGRADEAAAVCDAVEAEGVGVAASGLGLVRAVALLSDPSGGGCEAEAALPSAAEAADGTGPWGLLDAERALVLGHCVERSSGDAASASEQFAEAAELSARRLDAGADRVCDAASVHAAAVAAQNTRDALTQALKRVETAVGGGAADPACLDDILWRLAAQHARAGEAVIAEGLFRSSLSNVERRKGKSVFERRLLCDVLREYAGLLERMEWNGETRKGEADDLCARANSIDGEMQATMGSSSVWLERWIVQRFGR